MDVFLHEDLSSKLCPWPLFISCKPQDYGSISPPPPPRSNCRSLIIDLRALFLLLLLLLLVDVTVDPGRVGLVSEQVLFVIIGVHSPGLGSPIACAWVLLHGLWQ